MLRESKFMITTVAVEIGTSLTRLQIVLGDFKLDISMSLYVIQLMNGSHSRCYVL